jgi:hypothetical protein
MTKKINSDILGSEKQMNYSNFDDDSVSCGKYYQGRNLDKYSGYSDASSTEEFEDCDLED